jgi:hypothetical protein
LYVGTSSEQQVPDPRAWALYEILPGMQQVVDKDLEKTVFIIFAKMGMVKRPILIPSDVTVHECTFVPSQRSSISPSP